MSDATSRTESGNPLFVSTGHWAPQAMSSTSSDPLAGRHNVSSGARVRVVWPIVPAQYDVEIVPELRMSPEDSARRARQLIERLRPGHDVDLGDGD